MTAGNGFVLRPGQTYNLSGDRSPINSVRRHFRGSMMEEQPRQPRFSWRVKLAAFALLCLVLGWLVWQVQIVRERKAVLAELKQLSSQELDDWRLESLEARHGLVGNPADYDHLRISRFRRILGDDTFLLFEIPAACDPKLVERIEHAFPEAELHAYDLDKQEFSYRDSLSKPVQIRRPNRGSAFKTGSK